jgi:hypothetical protein
MLSKECSDTARRIFQVPQTMTDRHVAGQVKALAEVCKRQAARTADADAADHWLGRLLAPNVSAE